MHEELEVTQHEVRLLVGVTSPRLFALIMNGLDNYPGVMDWIADEVTEAESDAYADLTGEELINVYDDDFERIALFRAGLASAEQAGIEEVG